MKTLFLFIFWFCAVSIMHTYFLYPLILSLLSIFIKNPIKKDNIEPSVSMIISAYNEEEIILKKIEESLKLDYPRDKLQIIVASDCSSDNTDNIVLSFKDKGVVLVRQDRRLGKTAVQNKAATAAEGEILLFSDATTRYEKDVIKKIVRNFSDEKVGCVSAKLVYVDKDRSELGKSRNFYWEYEKSLKVKESNLNSLLGVSGCCYAVRKKLYKKIEPHLISDFVITWVIYEQGYRSVYEPEAVVYEDIVETSRKEIRMRIRVSSRSVIAIRKLKKFLNPLKFGFFSFQLFSHKLLRYFVPIFMMLIFASNSFLLNYKFYRLTFYLQIIFFLVGLISFKKKSFFYPLRYFIILNVAALIGIFRSADPVGLEIWQPIRK